MLRNLKKTLERNKLFTIIAISLVFALFVPFCSALSVAAEEEETNKWDSLEAAYMTAPFASIAERIYANGPTADAVMGNIPSMKLIYPTIDVFETVDEKLALNKQYIHWRLPFLLPSLIILLLKSYQQ